MEPIPPFRFTLHLNTGTILPLVIHPDPGDSQDPEAIADSMMSEFNDNRPAWYRLGEVLFFSGAITAIQVETF